MSALGERRRDVGRLEHHRCAGAGRRSHRPRAAAGPWGSCGRRAPVRWRSRRAVDVEHCEGERDGGHHRAEGVDEAARRSTTRSCGCAAARSRQPRSSASLLLGRRTQRAASPSRPPVIVKALVVALTCTVSGVRAGRASACSRWEASCSRSRARRHASTGDPRLEVAGRAGARAPRRAGAARPRGRWRGRRRSGRRRRGERSASSRDGVVPVALGDAAADLLLALHHELADVVQLAQVVGRVGVGDLQACGPPRPRSSPRRSAATGCAAARGAPSPAAAPPRRGPSRPCHPPRVLGE